MYLFMKTNLFRKKVVIQKITFLRKVKSKANEEQEKIP